MRFYSVDNIPGQASEKIDEKSRFEVAEGDEVAVVDEAVRVWIGVGDEKGDPDVEEEGELAGDVEKEEILRQASEEGEFERGEEGGVDCPYQDEM